MDIYTLDWGAIATFTGAVVALFISWKWRSQKGSEILSLKCEKVFFDLDTYLAKILEYNIRIIHSLGNPNVDTKIFEISYDVSTYYELLIKNLNLITTYKKDKCFLSVKNKIEVIHNSFNEIEIYISQRDDGIGSTDIEKFNGDINYIISKFSECSKMAQEYRDEIEKILSEYIFFKK